MIAKFQTHQDAKDYADQVHAYLQTFAGYIAERWSDVIELEGMFYVPMFIDIEPQTAYEQVERIPYIEEEL